MKTLFQLAMLLFIQQININCVWGQGCLRALKRASDPSGPPFNNNNGNKAVTANNNVQALIATYKFYCCGKITTWEAFVRPSGIDHQNGVYDITFQVWRPSPSNADCYSLVGQNAFTSITFAGSVELSPTPTQSAITVQPGDVVGYYTNSARKADEGIQLDRSSDYDENEIWYLPLGGSQPMFMGPASNLLSVGVNGYLTSLTSGAPALRVSASTFDNCPLSTVTSFSCLPMMQSSTQFLFLTTSVGFSSVMATAVTTSIEAPVFSSDINVGLSTLHPSSDLVPTSVIYVSSTVYSMAPSISSPSGMVEMSATDSISGSMGSMASSSVIAQTTLSDISPNNQSSSPIVAAIVVIVMLLTILAILSILIIFVFVRRKNSVKEIKLDKTLDLSNPSYMSSSATFLLKERNLHKAKLDDKCKAASSIIPDDTYESLNDEVLPHTTPEPLDYSLPFPSQPSTNLKPSLDAMFASGNSKDELQDGSLYHDVGPASGIKSTSGNSSEPPLIPTRYARDVRSFSNLPIGPPLPAKTAVNEGANNFYYALEEPSEVFYEDPLPHNQKLRAEESIGKRRLFEAIGTYVPTEEERDHYNSVKRPTKPVSNENKGSFYVEESIYWQPATTTSGLYSQLATKKYREITREQIRLKSILGSGQFGEVYKATWNIDEHELELAVKTLKAGASEEDKVKFLQEAAIMGQFSHTNVIKMYGVVTLGEPILICLEFLENGDLSEYLQDLNLVGSKYEDFIGTQLMFLRFAKDIASGMNYLAKKSFVHRDLAARNVLVNKFLTCKVADFGMTRDLMDDTYYKSSGGKIPVKWTAPEALLYQKYSANSDVWSYGMVLFEIWSVGRKPFSTLSNAHILQLIQQGFCQAPPPGCPRAIYQLMVDCWNPQHQSRPSFNTINLKYLSQSPEKLLHWAAEDNSLSPSVGVCGAPLLEAEELYPDLQKKYMKL